MKDLMVHFLSIRQQLAVVDAIQDRIDKLSFSARSKRKHEADIQMLEEVRLELLNAKSVAWIEN